MNRVVTFGEIMLRLAPPGYDRFVQADCFNVVYGGGEANVAIALAMLGVDACFVSKIPEHEIGQSAVNTLRRYGVDTSHIVRGGDRLGIYFLEKGASQRPSKVIYDRAGSAISKAESADFAWGDIFRGANWFHFTGITPALSDNAASVCLDAVKAARAAGLTISVDLNYRKKLWTRDKAQSVMSELMPYVDVCIANEEDAFNVFGIRASDTDIEKGKLNHQNYVSVAEQLTDRFDLSTVAITLRSSISANDNNWAGMLYSGKQAYFSKTYPVHIVDRVGGGDSFGAGLIYSLLNGKSSQEALDFAVAASCLKHSIEGDFNLVTAKEVENLVQGDSTGRVQR